MPDEFVMLKPCEPQKEGVIPFHDIGHYITALQAAKTWALARMQHDWPQRRVIREAILFRQMRGR